MTEHTCEQQTAFIPDCTDEEMWEAIDEGCGVFGGTPILCGKFAPCEFRARWFCEEHAADIMRIRNISREVGRRVGFKIEEVKCPQNTCSRCDVIRGTDGCSCPPHFLVDASDVFKQEKKQ